MKKKIIITGGLGYIGTELCKIYSGFSWKDSIVVIDNRFISERVNQLRKWNIEFICGDILDKKLISKPRLKNSLLTLEVQLYKFKPVILYHFFQTIQFLSKEIQQLISIPELYSYQLHFLKWPLH